MKREEAIKILQPIGEQYCEIANITLAPRMDEIAEAIDMAIDAIKAQLSQEGTTSDLISRQAAIDAVEKNACNTQRIMDAVNNLPPAQPEPHEGHWIEGGIYRDVIECNCSECGQLMTTAASVRMSFCPNCGAKMTTSK